MTVTASPAASRHRRNDLEDTRRLTRERETARRIASTWGLPVVLLHNSAPGELAGCHRSVLASGDPRNVPELLAGRLILQIRTTESVRTLLDAIRSSSASDPDPDLAAAVLATAFDGTGSRMRP